MQKDDKSASMILFFYDNKAHIDEAPELLKTYVYNDVITISYMSIILSPNGLQAIRTIWALRKFTMKTTEKRRKKYTSYQRFRNELLSLKYT